MTQKNLEDDCAFCADEIEISTFAQTDDFRAVYNIAPIVPGHVLIMPKRHEQQISELSADEFCDFWLFARGVTAFILEAFDTRAFDWTIQEMPEAGQTVPHIHLHVIPRVPDDFPNAGDWYPKLRSARIVEHASEVIDSGDRVKLTLEERAKIAQDLAHGWQDFAKRETKH